MILNICVVGQGYVGLPLALSFAEYGYKVFGLDNNLEKIINQIKKGNLNDILSKLCFVNENAVLINYIYFKYLATETTYNYIFIEFVKR